jgi:hypothetical protein
MLHNCHHFFLFLYAKIYHWECSAETVTSELLRQFFQLFAAKPGSSEDELGRTICNFYGSTEMLDVTYAVFRSIKDLEVSV